MYQGIVLMILGGGGCILGFPMIIGGVFVIIAGIMNLLFKKYPLIIDKEHFSYKPYFNSQVKYVFFKDVEHILIGNNCISVKSKGKTILIRKNTIKQGQWNDVKDIFNKYIKL